MVWYGTAVTRPYLLEEIQLTSKMGKVLWPHWEFKTVSLIVQTSQLYNLCEQVY